jgi:WD40 repeat protein
VASNKEETMVNMQIAQTDALVTGSADGTAKIWSLYSGECLFVSGFSSWFSGLKIVHAICFFYHNGGISYIKEPLFIDKISTSLQTKIHVKIPNEIYIEAF